MGLGTPNLIIDFREERFLLRSSYVSLLSMNYHNGRVKAIQNKLCNMLVGFSQLS